MVVLEKCSPAGSARTRTSRSPPNKSARCLAKLGIDTTAATEFIATNLPVLIDKLTPDGKVEANPAALPPTAQPPIA